jgi:hypothetical protein
LGLYVALGLFGFALLFRLIGIGWGLKNDLHNQSYHPDELVIFGYAQTIEPAKGKFTPGFYNYGTLYLTTLRIASDVVTGYTGGPDEKNPDSTWDWASRCHLGGRVVSALAGAGTVAVVFLLLFRFTNLFGSVFGALLVAVAPAHVVHSRFQTVDVLATFFLALSAYYALKLIPGKEPEEVADRAAMKFALLSGLFAGLSAGTKYTGILALATLVVALLLSKRPGWIKYGAAGIGMALLAFVVTTPGILLDTAKFMKDFRYEMTHTSTGHGLVFEGTANGFLYHFVNLLVGVGPILTVMGLAGLAFAVFRKQPWALALLAFFVLYYLLIGRAEVKFLRYTFPLYISMAAGFGYLVAEAQRRQGWGRLVVALGIAGIGGLDPGGMRQAAQMTAWMAGEDPRDSAARYLKTNGAGTSVGLVSDPWFYTPPMYPNTGVSRAVPFEARMQEMRAATDPQVVFHVPADPTVAPYDFNTDLLTVDRPERVTISSFEYGDLFRLRNVPGLSQLTQLQVDRAKAFQTQLEKDYKPEIGFGGDGLLVQAVHDLEYIRPQVSIWKRRDLP